MGDQWVDLPLAIQQGGGFTASWTLLNMMLMKLPPEAQRRFCVMSVPALATSPITSGSGSMRGLLVHDSKLWFVRGTELYYSSNGTTATLVGTVSGSARVRMVGAGAGQIAVVDGAGNQYTATTTVITAFALPAGVAADVTYMDGYIICPRAGTDEWYISALDGTTFAALDFSTADAISDTLVGVIACNRDLLLVGHVHTEIWYNAGASPFPFLRASPGVIERGCLSVYTIQKANGVPYLVGDDRRVYRITGYSPEPISTEPVSSVLGIVNYSGFAGSVYSSRDQLIYAIRLIAGSTLEYNITTGLWHRRDGNEGFRVNFTPAGTTKTYHAGEGPSSVTGVYALDPSTIDSTLTYFMGLPWFDMGGRRVFEHEVELIRPPIGTETGTVTMSTDDADDGSLRVTHATLDLSNYRLAWNRCGSFRRREHGFTWASPQYPIVIEAVRARMDVGL
jgi:hypothetical protein